MSRQRVFSQVDRDALLSGVDAEKVSRLIADERRSPLAAHVAASRALDLINVGAELRHQHRAIGPGEGVGEVENAQGV